MEIIARILCVETPELCELADHGVIRVPKIGTERRRFLLFYNRHAVSKFASLLTLLVEREVNTALNRNGVLLSFRILCLRWTRSAERERYCEHEKVVFNSAEAEKICPQSAIGSIPEQNRDFELDELGHECLTPDFPEE